MTSTATPRYQKQWRVDRARGITRTIPADSVREHLLHLLEGEATLRGIAEVSGIPLSVVARLARSRQSRVSRRVAAALLAVTTSELTQRSNPSGLVPKVGAVRRIRALHAIGHSASDIAAVSTLTERDVHDVVTQPGRWITQARWEAIARAYGHLSMTPGSSSKAREIAAAAGYPPPLAWDEEAIDDADAQPCEPDSDGGIDEVAVEAVMAGRRPEGLREPERIEAIRRLAEQGWADPDISATLGVTARTVLRLRQKHRISSRWSA